LLNKFLNTDLKKRLISNFSSLLLLKITTYIFPLITLPYLVRVLKIETYGFVMFAQSFIMFLNILVDFGFNLSATREIAVHRDNKKKLTEIFSSVMIIKGFLVALSFIILAILLFTIDKFTPHWKLYMCTFLIIVGHALFPIWYFQGLEKMKYITIVSITSKLLFTVTIFIFIHSQSDYLFVPILNGSGLITGSLLSLWILNKQFKQSFAFQKYTILKQYFIDSLQFFLSRVSVSLYTTINTVIIGIFTNNTMVGYYSIADKLYIVIQSIYGPINQVLYPFISKEKNIALFKKIFKLVVFLNIIGIIILFLFGQSIFNLLFTESIGIKAIQVFNILLLAALVVVPSMLIGYPFLGALGFAKIANKSVIYASLIHLSGIGMLILTNHLTIYSVAIMVVITQLFDLVFRVNGVVKHKLWYSSSKKVKCVEF